MNRNAPPVAALVAALVIAGCSAEPQELAEPQDANDVTEDANDVTEDANDVTPNDVDDGDVSGQSEPEVGGDAQEAGDLGDEHEPELLQRGGDALERNERSHVELADASPLEVHTEHDELMFTLEISDVHVDFACQGDEAAEAEGELIAIDFRIVTEPEAVLPDDGFFVDPHRFEIISLDEQTIADDPVSEASRNCLPDSDQFPQEDAPIVPGESGEGTVILETPSDAGHVLFYHRALDFIGEWTFDFS